jgi:hypothetical protein
LREVGTRFASNWAVHKKNIEILKVKAKKQNGDTKMLQFFSQTCTDLSAQVPYLSVPLPQVLILMLAISVAAMFERFRAVLLIAYTFLIHWVFIQNGSVLSTDRISVLTVVVFSVFGVLGMILTCYQLLMRNEM